MSARFSIACGLRKLSEVKPSSHPRNLIFTTFQRSSMNAKNVLTYAADQEARFVSVRFTDLPGAWHHLTFPIDQLTEDSFEDGFGFDASSLRGWASIHESDMLLVPDPSRFWI